VNSKLTALLPRREYATALAIIAILLVATLWARGTSESNPALVGQTVLVLLAAIGAYGLNLITGYAGQASMGNGGFMAIGAMTAWWIGNSGQSFVVSVLLGMVAGFVIGAIVGAVALRWRGFYLVLATLAVQFIVVFLIQRQQLNGPIEHQAGYSFDTAQIGGTVLLFDGDWFLLVSVVLAVIVLLIAGLLNGPLGRSWMALRENEAAASVAGVNTVWVKVLAFAIGSGIISLGGALAGYYAGAVGYESYPLAIAVSYVAMMIIGGVGSMAGPLLGAFAVTMIPYWVSSLSTTSLGESVLTSRGAAGLSYIQVLAYCVIVLLFLALEPRGLAALGTRIAHQIRRLVPGGGPSGDDGAPTPGPAAPDRVKEGVR
jgi:branched-chain amino acid transport system permease protein